MTVIGKDNAKHAMSVMTDEQISVIENAVQQIERIASISKIDYEKGIPLLYGLYYLSLITH